MSPAFECCAYEEPLSQYAKFRLYRLLSYEQFFSDECSFINPLGMESGVIKDHQIEASSVRMNDVNIN